MQRSCWAVPHLTLLPRHQAIAPRTRQFSARHGHRPTPQFVVSVAALPSLPLPHGSLDLAEDGERRK
ncbi:hypothetical protein PAHAL_3G326900 [Panicum hallii]|uniref:Uncharacterized protein n=1 Tax=Panicum hallii TaxID=206008 RepID=A0A2T8KK58_9POAL|nr:hypothetical protein PAHAL_3G326900 [Panicum hallii]